MELPLSVEQKERKQGKVITLKGNKKMEKTLTLLRVQIFARANCKYKVGNYQCCFYELSIQSFLK
jgi:hypothetical protein